MFLLIIKNELVKISASSVSWILMGALLLPPILVLIFIYPMGYDDFLQRIQSTTNDPNPYNYVFKWFQLVFNFLIVPFCTILLLWTLEIERVAMGWKTLLVLPVKSKHILYGKFVAVLIVLVISVSACFILFYGVIVLLKVTKADWPFLQFVMPGFFSILMLASYAFMLCIPATTLVFTLSFFIKSPSALIIAATFASFIPVKINPFRLHQDALKQFWNTLFDGQLDRGEIVVPFLLAISSILLLSLLINKALSNLK